MSSLTENRLGFYRQGVAFTAANTTYPVDLVTDPSIRNVADAANSNTNGVRMPKHYANVRVCVRSVVTADDPPTAAFAVYGYVRRVLTTAPGTFTDNDYTLSAVTEIPWDHLLNLNGGSVVTVTTQQVNSSVNILSPTANSFIFNQVFYVGGMYERLRVIPVVLTGTNVSCIIDVGFAGGEK